MCQQVASDDYPILVQKHAHLLESQHTTFFALDNHAQCDKHFYEFGFWFTGFRCLHAVILFMCAFTAMQEWEKKTKRIVSVKVHGCTPSSWLTLPELNLFGNHFSVKMWLERALILVSIRFMMSDVWEQMIFDSIPIRFYMWIGSITFCLQIAFNNLCLPPTASLASLSTAVATASTNDKALIPFHVVVAPAEKTTHSCQPDYQPEQPVHVTVVHKTKQLTATMSPLTIDNMVSIIDYMPSGTLQINAVAFVVMWLSRLVYFHGRHIGLPLFLSLCYERPYVMFSHVVFFTAEAGMIALLLLLWVLQSRLFEQRWCCAPCKTLGVNLNARIRPVGASYIRSFCCCFVIFHVLNTALRLNVFDCRPEVCVRVPCWVVSL